MSNFYLANEAAKRAEKLDEWLTSYRGKPDGVHALRVRLCGQEHEVAARLFGEMAEWHKTKQGMREREFEKAETEGA